MATIRGTNGKNRLKGTNSPDKLLGLAGNDTLDGKKGADKMIGGIGDDTYLVDHTGDKVIEKAGQGTDTVRSKVTFTLGANVENLYLLGTAAINGTGNELGNVIVGNAGNNVISGGAGADFLDGAGGFNTLSYFSSATGVEVNLSTSVVDVGDATGDIIANFTNVDGSNDGPFGDYIVGDGNNNVLRGFGGSDTLRGGGGNDTLEGGDGFDLIEGGADADNLDGGNDFDTLSYFFSANGVTVNLATNTASGGDAAGDTIANFEDLIGSNSTTSGDTLTGSDGENEISGESGDDTIDGGDGSDTIYGGFGNDTLLVSSDTDGLDTDALFGGDGVDTISLQNAGNGPFGGLTLTFTLGAGGSGSFNAPIGFGVADTSYNGIENVTGRNNASFGDILTGNSGNNVLNGLAGNDVLVITGGTDTLNGGDGTDMISFELSSTLGDLFVTLPSTGAGFADASAFGLGSFNYDSIEGVRGRDIASGARDLMTGNAGNNLFEGLAGDDFFEGLAGDDTYRGGDGNDAISFYTYGSSMTFTLAEGGSGTANLGSFGLGTDTYTSIEGIDGTNAAGDNLFGNSSNNIINGYGGDDAIVGGRGADTLYGGTGNDTFGFTGNTSGTDGSGADTIMDFVIASSDEIRLYDGADYDWFVATSGSNTVFSLFNNIAFAFTGDTVTVLNATGLVQGTDYFINDI
jgi:Ca2+-binding RTX toxin-like protein